MKRSISLIALLASCASVAAADLPAPVPTPVAPLPSLIAAPSPFLSGYEVRFGALAHDPLSPEAGGADLNAEVLFPKWWHATDTFWDEFIPHPDLGFTANFYGKTSNLYGGAAWNFELPYRFFVSGEFGGGVNNGKPGDYIPKGHNHVGCNVWFHESATAGYHITDAWSIMTTIEHSSNAGFCDQNRGLTNYGLRLGYSF